MAEKWSIQPIKSTAVDDDELLMIDSEDPSNATKSKRVKYSTLNTNVGDFTMKGDSLQNATDPSVSSFLEDTFNFDTVDGLFVQGDYAYVTSNANNIFSIINVTDPNTTPFLAGDIADATFLDGPTGVAVVGKYAYVCANGNNRLTVLDISDPTNPAIVGSFQDNVDMIGPNCIYVSGNYAYVAAGTSNSLVVIDISDPNNMFRADFVQDNTNLNGAFDVYVSGDFAYVTGFTGDSVACVDVKDPTNISVISFITGDTTNLDGASNIHVGGRYAYVAAANSNALSIIDVSDPTDISRVDTLIDPTNLANARGVFISGKYAYITSTFGLVVVDVSDPTNMSIVGKVADGTSLLTPFDSFVAGKYAYVISDTGMTFTVVSITGVDSPAINSGNIETGHLSVRDNAVIKNDLQARNLNVGKNTLLSGNTSINSALNMTDNLINNVADPVSAQDAATKNYVDTTTGKKEVVKLVATENITLSGDAQDIDGGIALDGNRILVTAQTNDEDNGIYVVAAGAWSRSADMNEADEFFEAEVLVEQGNVNATSIWFESLVVVTLETDPVSFTKNQTPLPVNTKYLFSESDFPPTESIDSNNVHPTDDIIQYIVAKDFSYVNPIFIDIAAENNFKSFSPQGSTLTYTGGSGDGIRSRSAGSDITSVSDQGGGQIRFATGDTGTLTIGDLVNIKADTVTAYTQLKATITGLTTNTSFDISGTFSSTDTGTWDRGILSLDLDNVKLASSGGSTGAVDVIFTKASEFTHYKSVGVSFDGFTSNSIIHDAKFVDERTNSISNSVGIVKFENCKNITTDSNTWGNSTTNTFDYLVEITGTDTKSVNIINNLFETEAVGDFALYIHAIASDASVLVSHNKDSRESADTLFQTSLTGGLDETDSRFTVKHNVRQDNSGEIELSIVKTDTLDRVTPLIPVLTLTKLPNPTLPGGNGESDAYSPDGRFLAIGHVSSPYLDIYEINGTTFTKLTGVLSDDPAGTVTGVSWSVNGRFLAVSHLSTPYITVYEKEGISFTKLVDPSPLPDSNGLDVDFSNNGRFLAVSVQNSPYVKIYELEGVDFVGLSNPGTLPGVTGTGVSFSSDSKFLAATSEGTPFVTIYDITGSTFTKIADPTPLPAGLGLDAAFSPNSEFLGVAHQTTPFMTVYQISGTTFTKLADPVPTPPSEGTRIEYSPNGRFLAIASTTTPFVTIYEQEDDNTFTKLTDPVALPAGIGQGIGWSPNSEFLSIAHLTTPFITTYQSQGTIPKKGVFRLIGT